MNSEERERFDRLMEQRRLELLIYEALTGDSNDAEHDALVAVAEYFGLVIP